MYAGATGYVGAYADAAPGETELVLTLLRPASVSGIVVMPDGAPAAGARVCVAGDYAGIEADEGGRFFLEKVDPEDRRIDASLRGLAVSEGIQLTEGRGVSVRLVLEAREDSFVRVRVLDAKGHGIPGAGVYGSREATDADGLATAVVQEPPGTEVELDVRSEGYLGASIRTRTSGSRDAPCVDVILRDAVVVEVEAGAPDGAPVDNPMVTFADGYRTFWGRDRSWHLDPDGVYTVQITARGFLPLELQDWKPSPRGGVLRVTLRPCAVVRGKAVDPDGVPLERVLVVFDPDGDRRSLRCEPDGSFLIREITETRGILVVGTADSFPGAAIEFSTLSGQTTDVGTLTLARHVTVTGRIVDQGSRPIGGASIRISMALPDTYERAFSYADGTFRIRVPRFVPVSLVASKEGFGTVRAEIGAGPARSAGDLVLPRPGSVEFEVEGLDPEEEDSVSIAILWPGSRTAANYLTAQGRMDDLAPGRYVARLMRGDTTAEQEVLVVAGETTRVTLPLER